MKNNSDYSYILNQSAALALAAAVVELFPEAQFLSGEGTAQYFFYDFTLPFAFQPDLLIWIEERMRVILKEKRVVKSLEMMPLNAADLLRHKGQLLAADLLSQEERSTVFLYQVGDCVIPSADIDLKELTIPFFKLFEGIVWEDSVLRIVGSAGKDKSVVKNLFKQTPYSSKSHPLLAIGAGLLAPSQGGSSWIWRSRGELVRKALIQWWEKECKSQNISLVSLPDVVNEKSLIQAHLDYFLRFNEPRVAQLSVISNESSTEKREGFFSPDVCFAERAYLFCSDQDFLKECISSLHFILQIPKILGFDFEVALSVSMEAPKNLRSQSVSLWEKAFEEVGVRARKEQVMGTAFVTCVEIRIADALGRKWTSPFVGIPLEPMPVGKGRMLVRSSFGSFERVLALLLEKTAGWLPLYFAPEQVRLIVLAPSVDNYACEVQQRLQAEGIRVGIDRGRDRLKSLLIDKVPYAVLLGDKEIAKQSITVRENETGIEESLSLDAFCVKVNTDLFNMGSRNSELAH